MASHPNSKTRKRAPTKTMAHRQLTHTYSSPPSPSPPPPGTSSSGTSWWSTTGSCRIQDNCISDSNLLAGSCAPSMRCPLGTRFCPRGPFLRAFSPAALLLANGVSHWHARRRCFRRSKQRAVHHHCPAIVADCHDRILHRVVLRLLDHPRYSL